jgi:hypothetical protein
MPRRGAPRADRPSTIGPDGICTECGQRHLTSRWQTPACTGHRSRTDDGEPVTADAPLKPCGNPPRRGLTVCGYHGGATAIAKAAGERNVAEKKAFDQLRRIGEAVDTTPTEALLDTVKWTAGYVAWLREKVALTTDDAGLTQYSKATGTHQPSAWLDLLGTWSDRLVKVCESAIRAGVEERRVRLAEGQGALVADVISKILGDLDLTEDQQAAVAEVVPRHLRLVAG